MSDPSGGARQVQGAAAGVIAGAALVALGTILNWVTVAGGFVVIDRSGLDYASDAKVILVLAVLTALGALGAMAGWQTLPGWLRPSAVVMALVIGAMLVNAWVQINDKVTEANGTFGVSARTGSGLYVTAAGALLMLLAGARLWSVSAPVRGLQFNSPPGWPPPPANFRPGKNWIPDPSWPPAPEGWQWWLTEDGGPVSRANAPWAHPSVR